MKNYLQLCYSLTFLRLYFSDEDIQEVILKNVDIHQVTKFNALDENDEPYMEIRNLFYYHSIFDLMYLNDDYGFRFMGVEMFLNNGIKIVTGMNLTTIYATSVEQLFDCIDHSITTLGFDTTICKELIKARPDEWISLILNSDGKTRAKKWSEESEAFHRSGEFGTVDVQLFTDPGFQL